MSEVSTLEDVTETPAAEPSAEPTVTEDDLVSPGTADDADDDSDAVAFAEGEGLVWVDGYGWMDPEDAAQELE